MLALPVLRLSLKLSLLQQVAIFSLRFLQNTIFMASAYKLLFSARFCTIRYIAHQLAMQYL
jgi:hypothetical protein